MLSWLRNVFKKPLPPKPAAKPKKDDSGFLALSELNTHVVDSRERRLQIIEAGMPAVCPHKTTAGVALDSGIADTAKANFVLGQSRLPETLFAWYVSQSFIGFQACGIIAQHWLVDKACSVKGRDAVRGGFAVTINDGEDIDPAVIKAIETANKKYRLHSHLEQADKFKNVFGIRHILFLVDTNDPTYYEKPFNPDSIKPGAYRGMTQIDPYWITPLLDAKAVANPEDTHFYEPTYWVISGQKYHRSHFVILRGPEVSDILKPSYIYGGLPLTQRIYERVYAAERTANEAPMLAMTKRLYTRRMNLEKVVAQQKKFTEALEAQAALRDNYGFLAVGEKEEVDQLETTLTDLDDTIMTQYQLVASITNAPATKLLGTSPKGFNATGEHEIETYNQELESIQTNDLQPVVEKHHIYVVRSDVAPQFNLAPFPVDIVWHSLDVPTEVEKATANETKARTDTLLVTAGAIDAYEVRERITADAESGYNTLETVERPPEAPEPDLSPPPTPGGPPDDAATPLAPAAGAQNGQTPANP